MAAIFKCTVFEYGLHLHYLLSLRLRTMHHYIQLRSPDIAAFELKEAIELWSAGGAQRPDTYPLGPRPGCESGIDSRDTDCDSSTSDAE